ncbi:MAG: ketoacyl-ACP synthase III [Flavobacteriales bacterium]|nr:ketoacyl-ACP synthase III [Flavobacteriales bacterium]MCB9174732.1 ketoacyl-ACP synthase III [Flavobacteriales bacterium]
MGCEIKAITCKLSTNKVTNEILAGKYDIQPSIIYKKTGILFRYNTTEDVIGSDLACRAAEDLFTTYNLDRNKIGFLLFCTEGLDYIAPMTACLIQDRLGLKNNIGALDLPSGCAGFTNSLGMAKAIIESGQSDNVLLLFGDTPGLVTNPNDFNLRALFSDAGAAVLIEKSNKNQIGNVVYGVDGRGSKHLFIDQSCLRNPINEEWLKTNRDVGGMPRGQMRMNGLEVFSFSIREVPLLVKQILEKNQLEMGDIDLFVFHQASTIILKSIQRKLRISDEKMAYYIEDFGNTVSVSIPLALSEAEKEKRISRGSKVLVAGYGIGFSWSGTVLYY